MTARAVRLPASPTPDEVADLLIYTLDRVKARDVLKGLEDYEEDASTHYVQTVSGLGLDHGMFHADAALLFHETRNTVLPSGVVADCRLLFLQSSSWLLWRRQTGGFKSVSVPSIEPTTWHYHTAELHPIFRELGIEGDNAIAAMRRLFTVIAPGIDWPMTWRGLRGRLVRTYRELV